MKPKSYLLALALLAQGVLGAQVPSFVPADSLVGFWRMDSSSQNALSTGPNLSFGSPEFGEDRNGNTNLALRNQEMYQNALTGFDAQTFTLGGWVKPQVLANSQDPNQLPGRIFNLEFVTGPPVFSPTSIVQFSVMSVFEADWSTPPVPIIQTGANHGKINFRVATSAGVQELWSSASYASDDSWRHFMISYDGAYLRLYTNGVCTDSVAATGSINYNSVGMEKSGWQSFTNLPNSNGVRQGLDDMGYWRRALSLCEIEQLYFASPNICSPMPTALEAQSQAQPLRLFPNPSNGRFELQGLSHSQTYQLFDALGRVLETGQLQPQMPQLDLSDKPAGLYWLRLSEGSTHQLLLQP